MVFRVLFQARDIIPVGDGTLLPNGMAAPVPDDSSLNFSLNRSTFPSPITRLDVLG
jgi:hypothetical protein